MHRQSKVKSHEPPQLYMTYCSTFFLQDVICEIESTGQLVEKLEAAINKTTVQATYPQGRGVETNG
jgi:hypothetical protein